MLTELCPVSSINEGQARAFNVASLADVFAVKRNGRLFLYLNICPHLRVPLNWEPDRFLNTSGDLIQCSTHGALFAIEDGECLQGPCRGQFLRRLDYEIRDDILYIDKQTLSADKITQK